MQTVTIFENVKAINKPYYRTIDLIVTRIKEGKSALLVNK